MFPLPFTLLGSAGAARGGILQGESPPAWGGERDVSGRILTRNELNPILWDSVTDKHG